MTTNNRVAESNSTDYGMAPRDGGGDDVICGDAEIWTESEMKAVQEAWAECVSIFGKLAECVEDSVVKAKEDDD